MELTNTSYGVIKTKAYLKKSSLIILFNGINKNSQDWLLTEQELKTINFSYYKVLNKATTKTFSSSIYHHMISIICGVTFLLEPSFEDNKLFLKKKLTHNFEPLLLTILAIKLNNVIYSTQLLKNIYSLAYDENILVSNVLNKASLKKNLFFLFEIRNNGI